MKDEDFTAALDDSEASSCRLSQLSRCLEGPKTSLVAELSFVETIGALLIAHLDWRLEAYDFFDCTD